MQKAHPISRPTFGQAFDYWTKLLQARGLPADCQWLFEENLCLEKGNEKQQLTLKYQTKFSPPAPRQAEQVAYKSFAHFAAPIVFYRIGSSKGKSLCVLLCDTWFDGKGDADGYLENPEWLMLFYAGHGVEVEEITDAERWKSRLIKSRPLHEVDFSMTLRAVHETLAHGRVLSSYEHYALKFLHAWRQFEREKIGLDNASPRR